MANQTLPLNVSDEMKSDDERQNCVGMESDEGLCSSSSDTTEELYSSSTTDTCGDCGRTTQKGYVEILEFTHFVEFFSFNRIAENHKEKELVRKVTVVVALDLGCGNTKNSEYESK